MHRTLIVMGFFAWSVALAPYGQPADASMHPGLLADCVTQAHGCYTPRVFRVAYGIQPLLDRGIDGRGVTVVLSEAAEPGPARPPVITDLRRDLSDFDHRFDLARPRIHVITALASSSTSPWLARTEEVEDTELVHAVAPKATIDELLVDPADMSTPAKAAAAFAAMMRLAIRHANVISLSLGIGEHFFTRAEVRTIHSTLEDAAARHVTFVASSGDDGVLGKGSLAPPLKEVSLPASDPLALAVGGTSLSANRVSGAYIGEAAWNTPSAVTDGDSSASGGGFSHLFARPSYQGGVDRIDAWRGVPDVAADASPFTGMALVRRSPGGIDLLTAAGGTSAAAPFWAGLIALADQEAGHSLGFVNPLIYRIARGPLYHKAFHDITIGNNTMTLASTSGPVTIAGHRAGPGWDAVTGWGTPDARVLVPLLAR